MSDPESFVLEQGWKAQTGRTWKIEFARIKDDDEHLYFRFSCEADEGDPFVYEPQVSRALLEAIGVDAEDKPKLVMRVVAGRGLEDLKVRLNAGHHKNFNGLPYCKTYTRRDADKLSKYMPGA